MSGNPGIEEEEWNMLRKLFLSVALTLAILTWPVMAADTVRVACVGDSITAGAGIRDRKMFYPAQLGRLLGSKYEVRNFGNSGATMLKKGNKPYWKQKQWAATLEFNPNIVVIKLGTNDAKPGNWKLKDRFAADYKDMIDQLAKLPAKPKIFICKPVPAFPGRWGITDKVISEEVIPITLQVARDKKLPVIDLYKALAGKKEMFPDTVHPNAAGAAVMAAVICEAITGKKAPLRWTQDKPAAAAVAEPLKGLDPFYKQYVVADGVRIVGSQKVSKYALREVAYLMRKMLARRPDVLKKLVERKVYVGVMAYNEMTTDLPECRGMSPWWDMRTRGFGGNPLTCAEENLLSFRGDHWQGESIFVHEFAHIVQGGLAALDKRFNARLGELHKKTKETGRFRGYSMNNPGEFWAESVQSWFNCNGTIRPKSAGGQSSLEVIGLKGQHVRHITTREQLKKHLPALAKLIDDAFGQNPWVYAPVVKRLDQPHLRGYDPTKAPTFRWPKKVIEAYNRIEAEKAKKAEKAKTEKAKRRDQGKRAEPNEATRAGQKSSLSVPALR